MSCFGLAGSAAAASASGSSSTDSSSSCPLTSALMMSTSRGCDERRATTFDGSTTSRTYGFLPFMPRPKTFSTMLKTVYSSSSRASVVEISVGISAESHTSSYLSVSSTSAWLKTSYIV